MENGIIFDLASVKVEDLSKEAGYGGAQVLITGELGKARCWVMTNIRLKDYLALLLMLERWHLGYAAETFIQIKFIAFTTSIYLDTLWMTSPSQPRLEGKRRGSEEDQRRASLFRRGLTGGGYDLLGGFVVNAILFKESWDG